MKDNFDPYENLMELNKFAKAADQHIGNLLKNQTEVVRAHNSNTTKIDELTKAINELRFDVLKLETLVKELRK